MRNVRGIFLCLCLALLLPPPQAVRAAGVVEFLPAEVEKLFKKHRINKGKTGLLIKSVDGTVLAAHQPQRAFNPASVVKVITALAALDILGAEFQWETKIAAQGKISNGVLEGDLVLIGGGDPYLTADDFLYMLNGLRNRGLREIRGDLVLDDTIFQLPPHDAAAFDGAQAKPYNVGGGGLIVNFKSQRVVFSAADGRVQVHAEPPNAHFEIVNRVKLSSKRCRNWRRQIREQLSDQQTHAQLKLSGSYSRHCGEQGFYLSVLDHRAYVAGVFGALWERLGGKWSGKWRTGKAAADAEVLLERTSPRLPLVLAAMNKYSNNVVARNVFLSLPASAGEPPHTPAAAQAVFAQWLGEQGVPEVVVDNGSGLSRRTRITPAQMTQLLEAAWRHPYRAELISSLPITGKDGTLRKRMKKAVAGEGHLKTGSLAGVTTISGYVRNDKGQYLMITLFAERQASGRVRRLQEDLIRWLRTAALP